MNREQHIQKAVIVREGVRTLEILGNKEVSHKFKNQAKKYVRTFLKGAGANAICVTGKGIIKQARYLHGLADPNTQPSAA